MKSVKRTAKICLALTLATLCFINTNVSAKDEDYSFYFKIGSYHANGRVDVGRYRQTTDKKNMWKVGMKFSGEGNGTTTNFWLEKKNEDNVSEDCQVRQSMTKQYYKAAYDSASKVTVYLTGENNNFDSNTYYVSGYWDEETGRYAG